MKTDNNSIYSYLSGKHEPDCCNFYDWFCKDTSLAKKEQTLKGYTAQLAWSPKIDINTMYVFFKNNCPCFGTLYDDLRICDMATGDVLYTVVPAVGYDSAKKDFKEGKRKGLAEVWGKENGFKEALVVGKWSDVLDFFFPKTRSAA